MQSLYTTRAPNWQWPMTRRSCCVPGNFWAKWRAVFANFRSRGDRPKACGNFVMSPLIGTRLTPVPMLPLCKCVYKFCSALIFSATDVFRAAPGLLSKDVKVLMVCSAFHLNPTLRITGTAVQSFLHCDSMRLAIPPMNSSVVTHGASGCVRRHR